MTKRVRFFVGLFGLLLMVVAWFFIRQSGSLATEIVPAITLTATEEFVLPSPTETMSVVVTTPTPTEMPLLVDNFFLNKTIDLSSGKSTVMAFYLPNGNLLSFPTWSNTVSEDSAEIAAFEPHQGTIYAVKSGDAIVALLHSGQVYFKYILAGSNFERFITRESVEDDGFVSFLQGSRLLTVAEGTEKANSLVGSMGYICQKEGVAPFTMYTGDCEGQLLQVRVKAVSLILGQQSMQYDWTIAKGEILPWLQANFSGFESASPRTGFLISTCIYQFADQPDLENLEPFLYNRLGIWLEIIY